MTLFASPSQGFFIPQGLQAFGYDPDGNLTSDSVWDYTYDAENRLVSMQHRPEVIGAGMIANTDARRLEFKYDYQGRRVRKTVYGGWNGTVYSGTALSDTKYLHHGWNLLAEFNALGSNAVLRTYTWGLDLTGSLTASGGVGALVQIYDSSVSKSLLPTYDGNGNVAALLNADTGALEAAYEYDPFGNLLRSEGDYAASNPFRFSTKYTDIETGLVYYGLRYYSPSLGRFINKDPIEEQGGLNLYAFCLNQPTNGWDYLGNVFSVRQTGNNVQIHISFYFPNATPAQRTAFLANVSSTWKGTAGNLNISTFVGTTGPARNGAPINTVTILSGDTGSYATGDLGNPNGSTSIFWNPANSAVNTPAHEVGHTLGLPDEYIGLFLLPGGIPLAVPQSALSGMGSLRGYRIGTAPLPGSRIMGNSSLNPDARDFLNILRNYNDRLRSGQGSGTSRNDSDTNEGGSENGGTADGDVLHLTPFVVTGSRSTGPSLSDELSNLQNTLGHRPNQAEWWNRAFIGGAPGSVQQRAESLLQQSWEEQQIQGFQQATGEGRRLQ